jgi:hypothetical protein
MLVVKRGQGGVSVIDFGSSCLITIGEDCKSERAQREDMKQVWILLVRFKWRGNRPPCS